MKTYQVTKRDYDGTGQIATQNLDIFSSTEAAQKYISEYVAKRGGNSRKLINGFTGQRDGVEIVITGFLPLPSVGSALSESGMIFPLNNDGTLNTYSGVDLKDCSDEWWARIDVEDRAACIDWAKNAGERGHGTIPGPWVTKDSEQDDEPLECDNCGAPYADGGDGWNGFCGPCADKIEQS